MVYLKLQATYAVESKNREDERSRDKDMDKEKYSLEFEPKPYKARVSPVLKIRELLDLPLLKIQTINQHNRVNIKGIKEWSVVCWRQRVSCLPI
jgi:hypothetical protein